MRMMMMTCYDDYIMIKDYHNIIITMLDAFYIDDDDNDDFFMNDGEYIERIEKELKIKEYFEQKLSNEGMYLFTLLFSILIIITILIAIIIFSTYHYVDCYNQYHNS